jgi:hypothetical protein
MRNRFVIAAGAQSASAAQAVGFPPLPSLPRTAPRSVEQPPAWQGCYGGVSCACAWSPNSITQGNLPASFTPIVTSGALAGDMSGATLGGRVGCDWHYSGYGLESDIFCFQLRDQRRPWRHWGVRLEPEQPRRGGGLPTLASALPSPINRACSMSSAARLMTPASSAWPAPSSFTRPPPPEAPAHPRPASDGMPRAPRLGSTATAECRRQVD